MGTKTFNNKTNSSLSLQLFVRKGDNPADLLNVQSLIIPAGKSERYTYSDNGNPYLNGMGVSTNGGPDAISSGEYVIQRGSAVDNLFNQNDTITIGMTGHSLVVQSSNA
ncbi:MAG: hypothetical protein QOJ94_2981 [Sphingomonadales bacterium]|jgi:hypothetical protein|nr:hypothetical protein [Sphingomonadales bacterium]